MFDINAIINAAIASAVEAHITDLKQAYANKMGEMAQTFEDYGRQIYALQEASAKNYQRISDLEEANKVLVHRLNELAERKPAADPVEIDTLNQKEWFWDKINNYIEKNVGRYGMNREEVAEIVRELWSEEFESEVRDVAEREIERYDFDEKITRAVRDYDFSDEIERAIDDYDLSDKVESALDEYDLDSKIENGIDSYDFDFESKVRDVLRNARLDISI
jgi:hypothetical protein